MSNPISTSGRPLSLLRHPWSSRCRWQGILLQWRYIVATGCCQLWTETGRRSSAGGYWDLPFAFSTDADVHRTWTSWMPKAAMQPWAKRHLVRLQGNSMLSDVTGRAFNAADIPGIEEPSGVNRQDGKRPFGLTLTHPTTRREAPCCARQHML